jgi:aminoglycoside 6'-N-acetyltransferase I
MRSYSKHLETDEGRIIIRRVQPIDRAEWLRLRLALWPEPQHKPSDLESEMEEIIAAPEQPVFVAIGPEGGLCGFLEVSIHSEAEGCSTDRIGYLEGWYVDPDMRSRRIGRKLVEAAEQWAREQGCTEMASDTTPNYPLSTEAHARLGYQEVGCTIHFRKDL